jgi:glycosyltransferase involved in cell wall biosynthesis
VKREKIIVVGPVGPTRGGIARHTERTVEELLKDLDCVVLSDSKLFSDHLYPGKFQDASWLSVPQAPGLQVKRKRFPSILSDLWKIDPKTVSGALVIWWTPALAAKFVLTHLVLRIRRIKSVTFCHNAEPRSRSISTRLITVAGLSVSDSLIVQTTRDAMFIRNKLGPSKNVEVVGHPAYKPTNSFRRAIPRSGKTTNVLFFGHVRRYKGLETLLEAARSITDPTIKIRIVGESWSRELTSAVMSAAEFKPAQITYKLDFVSDLEAEEELSESDVVVLPYLSATGSGVLAQAIGLDKPVIVSDIPEFRSVVRDGVDGWFFEVGNPASLAAAMSKAANALAATTIYPWRDNALLESWDKVSKEILRMIQAQQ